MCYFYRTDWKTIRKQREGRKDLRQSFNAGSLKDKEEENYED